MKIGKVCIALSSFSMATALPRHGKNEHAVGPAAADFLHRLARALASTSSSRLLPPGNRSTREHRPPMEPAASSSMAGPAFWVTRSSAWIGPVIRRRSLAAESIAGLHEVEVS